MVLWLAMLCLKPSLPPASSTMAFAVLRLESISRAIHKTYCSMMDSDGGSTAAYEHFRARAYLLLSHYIDNGLRDAFQWLLMMNEAAPRRTRISLKDNPFHWGLLAMTAAAGPFMSANKLRDLAAFMNQAHAIGVPWAELEAFIRNHRKQERREGIDAFISAITERHARTAGQR